MCQAGQVCMCSLYQHVPRALVCAILIVGNKECYFFGRIYKEEHYILLQYLYESSGPCGFREFFLCFSHDIPGARPVCTPGAQSAGFVKRTTIHCY